MAETTRGGKKETKKKKRKKKFSGRKFVVWLFFTGAIAVICGIIGYLLVTLNGERIVADNMDKFDLPEASIIYDVGGNAVTKLYRENRENVEYSEIPELMRDAFIATEDRRFEQHSGIDLWSIGRALVTDITAGGAVEGASTITQQLAKNLFLTQDKTLFRKATEASIAVALEHKMTKDEILTMYLNRIPFGSSYGVKAAAKYYFSKSLDQLELWEIATLAGIPKAPSHYNPINHPEESKERRGVVLQLMYDQGYITKEQMDHAKNVDYDPNARSKTSQQYPAFIDFVVNEVEAKTGLTDEQLRSGGYKIFTTLNTKAQSTMEKEFEDDSNFEKSVDDQKSQAAMIVVDHRNGNIQGLVGGRDYVRTGWNRVTVPRQPGSGFKPITVYGPAIDSGDWFPWSIVQDEKKCYGGNYCPSDSNANKYLGPITIRQSIKESRNASAVWLLNEIGVKTGYNFAEKLGFQLDDKNDRNLAIALGGLYKGVTPLQMATAYSVIANGGKSVDAHSVLKVVDTDNDTVYQYKAPPAKQLMKESTAYYLTDIMQGVVEKGGTGAQAKIARPLAGKTGTTQAGLPGVNSNYNRDAWFNGFTAEWTGIVWMGYDKTDKDHLLKKSSSSAAALFAKVMTEAMEGMPVHDFTKPEGVKDQEQPPKAVNGLSAAYDDETKSVTLSWNPLDGEGLTYRLYRKAQGEADFSRLMDSLTSTGVDDMSVAPGVSYEYFVTAYNAQNELESAHSNHVTIAVPEAELDPGDGTFPGDNGEGPGNGTGPGDNGEGPDNGTGPGDNGNGPGNGTGPGDNGNGPGNGTGPGDNGNGPGNGTGPGDNGEGPGNGTGPGDNGEGPGNGTGPGDNGNGPGNGTGQGDSGSPDNGAIGPGDNGSGGGNDGADRPGRGGKGRKDDNVLFSQNASPDSNAGATDGIIDVPADTGNGG